MSYNIGISAYYHDSSVAVFKNGELVFACEEEKFTGIKHDSSFPNKALEYCIKRYGITDTDLEAICFYELPSLKWDRVWRTSLKSLFKNPAFSISSIINFAKNRFDFWQNTKKFGSDKVFYSNHHQSHLYYSAVSSPNKRSVVVSLDGVGEWDTAKAALWNGGKLEDLITLGTYPHSLGLC
jgi:carbamoyltransferase